jgi:transketolase
MTTTAVPSGTSLEVVAELAAQLRVDSVRSSTRAGSGHPTSSMSAADLLAVLVTRHLHYDWDDPRLAANDHLIFSKGTPRRCCTRCSRPSASSPRRS